MAGQVALSLEQELTGRQRGMRIEYHRTLVADAPRLRAFHQALRSLIRPGESIVADIGAGSGVLGLIAARLGAKHVYLYESAEVADVAAATLRANRVRNATLLPCRSTVMDDPPRADIVVSETLGNYALEEDIASIMADARRRHLKPGGALAPRLVEQFAAPVATQRIDEELRAWDRVGPMLGLDIDFAEAQRMSLNNMYVRTLAPADLAAPALVWDTVRLGHDARAARKGEIAWTAATDTTVRGFGLWWRTELCDGVSLSTAPDAPPTHWEQLYLPLTEPIEWRAGSRLSLFMRTRTSEEAGTTAAWTATLDDASGKRLARQSLDLEKGYLP